MLAHFFWPFLGMNETLRGMKRQIIKVIGLFITNLLTKEDNDYRIELVAKIDQMKIDQDSEISELAFDCDTDIILGFKGSDDDKIFREQQFLQLEEELEELDQREQEEYFLKKKSENDCSSDLQKIAYDSRPQRKKTMRLNSKVKLQPAKKLVKRNSMNPSILKDSNNSTIGKGSKQGKHHAKASEGSMSNKSSASTSDMTMTFTKRADQVSRIHRKASQ